MILLQIWSHRTTIRRCSFGDQLVSQHKLSTNSILFLTVKRIGTHYFIPKLQKRIWQPLPTGTLVLRQIQNGGTVLSTASGLLRAQPCLCKLYHIILESIKFKMHSYASNQREHTLKIRLSLKDSLASQFLLLMESGQSFFGNKPKWEMMINWLLFESSSQVKL